MSGEQPMHEVFIYSEHSSNSFNSIKKAVVVVGPRLWCSVKPEEDITNLLTLQ